MEAELEAELEAEQGGAATQIQSVVRGNQSRNHTRTRRRSSVSNVLLVGTAAGVAAGALSMVGVTMGLMEEGVDECACGIRLGDLLDPDP